MGVKARHDVAGGLGARYPIGHDAGAGQRLDLLHCHRHSVMVGGQKALVTRHQCHHGDTLGGRKRQVIAGAVSLLAIHDAREFSAIGEFTLGNGIEGGPVNGATQSKAVGPVNGATQSKAVGPFPHPDRFELAHGVIVFLGSVVGRAALDGGK